MCIKKKNNENIFLFRKQDLFNIPKQDRIISLDLIFTLEYFSLGSPSFYIFLLAFLWSPWYFFSLYLFFFHFISSIWNYFVLYFLPPLLSASRMRRIYSLFIIAVFLIFILFLIYYLLFDYSLYSMLTLYIHTYIHIRIYVCLQLIYIILIYNNI